MDHEREPLPLYVLNRFLRFEKKIYRFNDITFARPIYLKTVLYFLVSFLVTGIIVLLPGPGTIIRMLPSFFIMLTMIGVPTLAAYLLAGIGMENRPPLNSFYAAIRFHIHKAKGHSYYKGKIIQNPQPIHFINTSTVQIEDEPKNTRGNRNETSDKLSSEAHREKSDNEQGRDSLGIL